MKDWLPFHDLIAALIVVMWLGALIGLKATGHDAPSDLEGAGLVALGWLFRGAPGVIAASRASDTPASKPAP